MFDQTDPLTLATIAAGALIVCGLAIGLLVAQQWRGDRHLRKRLRAMRAEED